MNENTIEINGRKYKVRKTLRSLFIFEKLMNKPFQIETMLDNYAFFYSILLANNPEDPVGWDEFIDALDTDPSIFTTMAAILERQGKAEEILESGEEEPEGEKKN